MIKLFHITYVILYLIFGLSNQVFADGIDTKELNNKKMNLTFSNIHFDNNTIDSYTYYDFLRESIITQPEFLFANSNYIEKDEQLKFTKRQKWPELSVRVINDHVLDRDVSEFNSLRKRQDDSFDAAVELSQPIYSGGTINAQIRKAFSDKKLSSTEKQNALSILILDANEIYLNAVKSNTLYEYGLKLVKEIEPYLNKVRDRVSLGITDPIELALFSIKFNTLKSKVQILKTSRNRDIGIFEYFFGRGYTNNSFPNIFVPSLEMNKKIESYDVKGARLFLESSKEDTNIVKGEFRPKFGFNTRYTVYDLDENENDTDIRGGIFFSMPLFTFGRASAKIAASKAKENATRVSIDIERKQDDYLILDFDANI
jgi:outer membrane protein TolC